MCAIKEYRIDLYFSEEAWEQMEELADRAGTSIGDLIKRGIAILRFKVRAEEHGKKLLVAKKRRFFGGWKVFEVVYGGETEDE
ncbi:hypothetical protein KKH05_00335 [Patescibacteria group bacterium]|nr:hypothetical protein [Patescibacteria group bacterium]